MQTKGFQTGASTTLHAGEGNSPHRASLSQQRRLKEETKNVNSHFSFPQSPGKCETEVHILLLSTILSMLRFPLTVYILPANRKLAFHFLLLRWESWLSSWLEACSWHCILTDKNNSISNQHLLNSYSARYCTKCWTCIIPFNPPNHYEVPPLFLFYR